LDAFAIKMYLDYMAWLARKGVAAVMARRADRLPGTFGMAATGHRHLPASDGANG
jgi:hypothetical protein